MKMLAPCSWPQVLVGYGQREVWEHPWRTPQLHPGLAASSIPSRCSQDTKKLNCSDIHNADVCSQL